MFVHDFSVLQRIRSRLLELENQSAAIAKVVLAACARERIAVAGEHVIKFSEAEGQVLVDVDVESCTKRHRERVLCSHGHGSARIIDGIPKVGVSVCLRSAEEGLTKRSDFGDGNTNYRTE